jgi:hypothetical protein
MEPEGQDHRDIVSESEIDLKELLSYKNPNAKEYKRLTKEGRFLLGDSGPSATAMLSEFCLKLKPESRSLIQRAFEGSMVIEPGGSKGEAGSKLSQEFGAALHINVDRSPQPFVNDKTHPLDPFKPVKEENEKGFTDMTVKADMLDFVSRLDDRSANFIFTFLTTEVMDPPYHEALARELARATQDYGLILTDDSSYASGVLNRKFTKKKAGDSGSLVQLPIVPEDSMFKFFKRID